VFTAATTTTSSLVPTVSESGCSEHWFAVYTCANHEKRVAAHFEARAVNHFLPLYSSLRRWKDRRVRLELPLFPGYIFVQLAKDVHLRVLEVPERIADCSTRLSKDWISCADCQGASRRSRGNSGPQEECSPRCAIARPHSAICRSGD
jgi:hypothetical protein